MASLIRYHLASDSARERDDWIRVLCACGAQLSASSSAVAPPSSPLPVATAATAGGGVSTHARQSEVIKVPSSSASAAEDATSRGTELSGLLYKRASKVPSASLMGCRLRPSSVRARRRLLDQDDL